MLQLYVHYLLVLVDYFSGNLGGASHRSHDPLDAVVDEEPAVDDLCIFSVLPATSSDFFSKMSVDLLSTNTYGPLAIRSQNRHDKHGSMLGEIIYNDWLDHAFEELDDLDLFSTHSLTFFASCLSPVDSAIFKREIGRVCLCGVRARPKWLRMRMLRGYIRRMMLLIMIVMTIMLIMIMVIMIVTVNIILVPVPF